MPVETRTMPGKITRDENGEELASGWCLVAFETTGRGVPLDDWRGEMGCADAGARQAIAELDGEALYLHLEPYGGEFEPWHGPVRASLVSEDLDPDSRRIALKAAGTLTRSLYYKPEAENHEKEPAEARG
jgi:hypothetical protein